MSLTVKLEDLIAALDEVSSSLELNKDRYSAWGDEIKESLQYAIDNYNKQNKDSYIAALEAKVYTYEMIIAKSNFRSMLDPTRNNQNRQNNKQGNRQNNGQRPYNNQRGNGRSSLGQRSQNRTQYRSQNGSYRPVNGQYNNRSNDNGVEE